MNEVKKHINSAAKYCREAHKMMEAGPGFEDGCWASVDDIGELVTLTAQSVEFVAQANEKLIKTLTNIDYELGSLANEFEELELTTQAKQLDQIRGWILMVRDMHGGEDGE